MDTSETVLQTLKAGNAAYVKSGAFSGDISKERRLQRKRRGHRLRGLPRHP